MFRPPHRKHHGRLLQLLSSPECSLGTARARDSHRTNIAAELRALVERCLEKDPARRFATADALEQALAECRCADDWTPKQAATWWRQHGLTLKDGPPKQLSANQCGCP